MKKLLWFGAGMLVMASFSVFAATTTFKDEGRFADWYKSAVAKLKGVGVITGYSDGEFKPNNQVNRGEIAVMLDRLHTQTTKDATQNFNTSMLRVLTATDKNKNLISRYKNFIIMAEAGLNITEKPDLEGMRVVEDAGLPQGFTLYEQPNYIFSYYLHYVGLSTYSVILNDAIGEVDVWFGPF